MSALSATLRIARRDAGRAKIRSGLVVAMIALPLVGVGAADVIWRSFQLSPDQEASRVMGTADGLLQDMRFVSIKQQRNGSYESGAERPGPAPAITSVLPSGSGVQMMKSASGRVSLGDISVVVELRALDYDTPLANGLIQERESYFQGSADVALTPALAKRLDAFNAHVTIANESWEVGSIVESTTSRKAEVAVFRELPKGVSDVQTSYLVDSPRPLTWADVERANAAGFLLRPRTVAADAPPLPYEQQSVVDASTLTAISLIVGMVLLEIVLLAGPAFAVGAKRQSRDLALLAATGAERRDVRRTVLGSGLVLGAIGGVLGVLGGLVLARLAIPLLSERTGDVPGPFDVRVLELGALVLVGVTTAVLAAVIPARNAAHQDVVGALTGHRGQLRSLRRTPVLGAIAAVAGAVVALQGARQRDVNVILAGSMLAELGLVATTPFLVGQIGRLSPHLPLGPRLALRDAARNRTRTAPAVSAVLAAVAGSVAIGTYVASLDQYDREAYQPSAVHRSAVVAFYDIADVEKKSVAVSALMGQHLPGAEIREVRAVVPPPQSTRYLELMTVAQLPCSVQEGSVPTRAQLLAAQREPQCSSSYSQYHRYSSQWLVGGPESLRALTGQSTPDQEAVLRKGGAIVPARNIDSNGMTTFQVLDSPNELEPSEPPPAPVVVRSISVPAVALPLAAYQATLLSPQAAAKTGVPVSLVGVVALGDQMPSTRTEDRLRTAMAKIGVEGLQVERGYVSDYGLGLLALVVGSAVIVLGASGIATGLAAADGKADLSTLAAIGASPRTRRSLAAFQSAVTAGLGTLLGVAAGLVPAIGMVRALNAAALDGNFPRLDPYPLVLPWTNLAVTVLVVPVIAAGVAALLTRSRLPMVRRIG